MNWKNLLFSFEGRVGRGPYWMFLVVTLVVFGVLAAISMIAMMNAQDPSSDRDAGFHLARTGDSSQALARRGQIRLVDSDWVGPRDRWTDRLGVQWLYCRYTGSESLRFRSGQSAGCDARDGSLLIEKRGGGLRFPANPSAATTRFHCRRIAFGNGARIQEQDSTLIGMALT